MIVWQAHKSRIRHMAFAPDGAELATTAGSSKFVSLWRAATGEAAGRLVGHTTYARAVAYSLDGRFVAATQNTAAARVWDRSTGAVVAVLKTSGWCLDSVTFRPDSSAVAVPTDRGVGEWRCSDFNGGSRPLAPGARLGSTSAFRRILFSPCGRYLAASEFRDFNLFDAAGQSGLICRLPDPQGKAGDATQFSFAPDGNTLAVVYGLRIHLFALPRGKELAVLRGHPNYIHAVGFMPDGREMVSAGADGIVRVWNPATGAETRSFDWGIGKVCAAAISPDGMLCAAGGENGKVVVWDVDA